MPDSPHVKINLIGKQKVSVKDDFLDWAVKIGKIIIVATELIALAALIYRFTIDSKIINLHDKIKNAELFVVSQKAKEETFRSIQTRLDNIKKTEAETDTKIKILNDVLAAASSGDFSSTNLTVSNNTIQFDGTSLSVFKINEFIEDLKKNPNVGGISLDDVSSTLQGTQFKITIQLNFENS
jgi:hypothetical protein